MIKRYIVFTIIFLSNIIWTQESEDPKIRYYIHAIADPEQKVRIQAAISLGMMGEKASPAVSALLQNISLDNPEELKYQKFALVQIGEKAIPFLLEELLATKGEYFERRVVIAQVLGEMKKEQAVAGLIQVLEEPSESLYIRDEIIKIFGTLGKDGVQAMPILIKNHLQGGRWLAYRKYPWPYIDPYQATLALVKIAREANQEDAVVPVFLDGVSNFNNKPLQIRSLVGLRYFKEKAAPALPSLMQILGKEKPADEFEMYMLVCMQRCVIKCLGSIGEQAAPAIPFLMKILGDKKEYKDERSPIGYGSFTIMFSLSDCAVYALAGIGEKSIPALREALLDADTHVRINAAKALGMIQKKTANHELTTKQNGQSFAVLVETLSQSSNPEERRKAADVLSQMRDEKAVNYLVKMLNDSDNRVAEIAQQALEEMSEKSIPYLMKILEEYENPQAMRVCLDIFMGMGDKSLPYLKNALKHPNINVRCVILSALCSLQEKAAPALPALIPLLADAEEGIVARAALVLQAIGEQAAPAVPALSQVLSHKSSYARESAALALSNIGKKAAPAVPQLIKALSDESQQVRIYAVEALGSIGEESEPAVHSLCKLLSYPDRRIKIAVAAALGEIGPKARLAIQTLITTLNDEDTQVRITVIISLRKIAQEVPLIVHAFLQTLMEEKEQAVITTVEESVIEKFGKNSLPYLERALNNKAFTKIHSQIQEMLQKIQQKK
jgi:HEAT repeat protein